VAESDGAAALGRAQRLHEDLTARLAARRQETSGNPYANPIQLLALDIARRLDGGELDEAAVEDLLQLLVGEAFAERAGRLGAYLGEIDPAANRAILERLIRWLAHGPDGALLPFTAFQAALGRELFGLVATAHPTFALPAGLMRSLAMLAGGHDLAGAPLSEGELARLRAEAVVADHRPEPRLDLAFEHRLSIEAIGNMQAALRELYTIATAVAEELYPEDWTRLVPRLVTLASWVGYDLDGRSDIKWSDSLMKRMRLQAVQLEQYRTSLRSLRGRLGPEVAIELGHTLELLESRLALAGKEVEDEIAVFQDGGAGRTPAEWHESVRRIARRMNDSRDLRLIEAAPLRRLIDRAIALAPEPETRRTLCVLRAELDNLGLGMAHTHVRINATQMHNAIRKSIGMETPPDDPTRRRSYIAAIGDLIDRVQPVQVNFGSILAEKSTAKRLFMLVAQMLKHVDATTPVRFLIAECETSFTLLTGLYYARLFDVADRLDISPLIETEKAFERGARMIEDCLQNPHYAAYLRKRGRLCIQTGLSDAGRFLGQTTAAAAVELLRFQIARVLQERGFADIELVIFDTHGESIGRGAHRSSFADRLAYIASAASRRQFAERGIRVKQEVSFQGGDGYLYFMTPTLALAVLTRILEFALEPPAEPADDPYYLDFDYATEFFVTIRKFNERVMRDPDYAALLDAYGANLLYPSGSRALRRDDGGPRVELSSPAQLRAIPHNGILQQLGLLSNSLGGAGAAIARDPEKFQRFYRDSPRFRRLFAVVEWAAEFSDTDLLQAYVDLLDPGLWLAQTARGGVGDPGERRRLSEHLERAGLHDRLQRVVRALARDRLDLMAGLASARNGQGGALIPGIGAARRDDLHLLHALRIALLQRLFLLATHIPPFSAQHPITPDELMAKVLHLDIEAALRQLAIIFPKVDPLDLTGDFGEVATYRTDETQSYEQEHARIFQPLGRLYDLARQAGIGVTHIVGALG
jgi:phosphoenolpyruvate carboxylase